MSTDAIGALTGGGAQASSWWAEMYKPPSSDVKVPKVEGMPPIPPSNTFASRVVAEALNARAAAREKAAEAAKFSAAHEAFQPPDPKVYEKPVAPRPDGAQVRAVWEPTDAKTDTIRIRAASHSPQVHAASDAPPPEVPTYGSTTATAPASPVFTAMIWSSRTAASQAVVSTMSHEAPSTGPTPRLLPAHA